jgi:hypothetical protein
VATALPESFFGLRRIQAVDLRHTKLGQPTPNRLRTVFPHFA